MSDFKVGDHVVVLPRIRGMEYDGALNPGDVGVIKRIVDDCKYNIRVERLDGSDDELFNSKQIKMHVKTLHNLIDGDVVVGEWGTEGDNEMVVQGKIGDVYILVNKDSESSIYTAKELEELDFKPKQEKVEDDTQELTVEQIAEKLGHKVKVVEG